jgi:dihydropyrimidinase
MFDLVISNGTAVIDGRPAAADIAVQGEQIAAIASRGTALPARRTVDVTGMLVLPGGIDPHVHIRCFNDVADDFATASRSAAFGGCTTLGVFVVGRQGDTVGSTLDHFIAEGNGTSHADFVLHCVLRPGETMQVGDAFARNVRTIKIFMGYLSLGQVVPDDEIVRLMRDVRDGGGLLMVHAENGYLIDHLETQFRTRGEATWEAFLPSRPALAEQEAIHRAIFFSDLTGCPVYVVHLSTREGLALIAEAQRAGKPIFTETCPQYLTLTNAILAEQGVLAKIGPPLRTEEHLDALWHGLQSGTIGCLGSDHAPFMAETKRTARYPNQPDDFFSAYFGAPGVEIMLPLTYSEGVVRGRLTLAQWVKATTENPARQFGLFPRKGTLRVGSDADICVFDPERRWTVRAREMHSVDYSCWEGWTIQGKPVMTFLRGRPVLVDGAVAAAAGRHLTLEPLSPSGRH